MARREVMSDLISEFETIVAKEPENGRSLFESSARLNSFWFRNRLPSCDAHDTVNLIDSEGEERFKPGAENLFGSPEKFYQTYIEFYRTAIQQMRSMIAKSSRT